jgi:phenylpropionate dioxygenase-like ring-hydroxylating dioxygenase large terminal subunit
MYLRNAWYVAGFAAEVDISRPLVRRLLDQPLVFIRKPDGEVVALANRYLRRFAPLRGATYPALERHGLLWWWPGEATLADPNLIPDYSALGRAQPDAAFRGYLPTQCHYELLVDNILDLTHADYLHAGTLGNGSLTRAKAHITDLGERSLNVTWLCSGECAPPAFDAQLKRHGEPTDQWTEVTWTAPGNMLLRVGATLQGEERAQGIEVLTLHLATPQTRSSTHYWFWSMRSFAISAVENARIRGFVEYAFAQQDKPMLEAQQVNLDGADFWSMQPLLLASDAAAVRARRKLANLCTSTS